MASLIDGFWAYPAKNGRSRRSCSERCVWRERECICIVIDV